MYFWLKKNKKEVLSKFDFLYEEKEISTDLARSMILEETMLYHDIYTFNNYMEEKKKYVELENKIRNKGMRRSSLVLLLFNVIEKVKHG